MSSASEIAAVARELIHRSMHLRNWWQTEDIEDEWIELHRARCEPGIDGEFGESERALFRYMMIGEHSPINDPLHKKWDAVFKILSDEDGALPRTTREAKKLAKEFCESTVLAADNVARRIAWARVILGITSLFGSPQACCWTSGDWHGVYRTAFAWGYEVSSGPAMVAVDQKARKIYLVSDWEEGPYPVSILRHLVADSEAPEFGFTVEWHVAIFRKQHDLAVLEDPRSLFDCLLGQPDRLWFVGSGRQYDARANAEAKDAKQLMLSALDNAEQIFRGDISACAVDELEAWAKAIRFAEERLFTLDPDWPGPSTGLLNAAAGLVETLEQQGRPKCEDAQRELQVFLLPRKRNTVERSSNKPRPNPNNPEVLPAEIRDAELSRYAAAKLARGTPAATGDALAGSLCEHCGRASHPGRCRL